MFRAVPGPDCSITQARLPEVASAMFLIGSTRAWPHKTSILKKNYAVLVLQNVSHYNGAVNYFWDNGKNRTMGFVCYAPGTKGTTSGFENVVVHEIGGHAIGHLADPVPNITKCNLNGFTKTTNETISVLRLV